ncbi:MAG: CRISPR-associated helicase Cas3' [Bacteroidales bacterium]|nr:CRISPR-associated helicase Cas3' [Bacteroidales bacterium]
MKILAKSNPEKTLIEHTLDTIKCFKKVLFWQNKLIDSYCNEYKLDKEHLIRNLYFTIAFHDIGKSTQQFQNKIKGSDDNMNSHSLASVPFIFDVTKDKLLFDKFFPETLSVATHHTRLTKNVFFEKFGNWKPLYIETFYSSFFEVINEEAKQFNFEWLDLKFNSSILVEIPYHLFNDNVLDETISDDFFRIKGKKYRDIYLLFQSVLHYSDWLASADYEDYGYATCHNYDSITKRMILLYPDKFLKWSDFQKKTAKSKGHVFVKIPTGQGKTEASLLWAVNNNQQKIIYLLPTMVTTNKMWQRLKLFFGIDQTGLSHSTANYIISKKHPEIEDQKLRIHYLYNKTFFKEVTVATIDQLIFAFFNWGRWVLPNSSIYNARIIIDEVHVYDGYTFGLLLKCLELIKPFNTQFAIMSASLPKFLQEKIERIIPKEEITFIEDVGFDNLQRHKVFVTDVLIDNEIDNIKNQFHLGRNVLIVCNTIKKARKIYDLLNESISKDKLMLYHSQFILKDKIQKENFLEKIGKINSGFIAICTQIVEVSLDIDFDVLFTENAPIDAIVQRLGRVNRKGDIHERHKELSYADVFISKENEISRKYIYDLCILDKTYSLIKQYSDNLSGNLKEIHFKKIINEVYTKDNLSEKFFTDLEEGCQFIEKVWKNCVFNILTLTSDEKELLKVSTRRSSYITVECVLQIHNIELNFEDLIEQHKYDIVREYSLKVPLHVAKKYLIKKIGETDIHLIDVPYNIEEGLSFEKTEANFP